MTSMIETINIVIDLSMGVDYPQICNSCLTEACEHRSERVIMCADLTNKEDTK